MLKYSFFIIHLFISTLIAETVNITDKVNFLDILPVSKIYIDYNSSYHINKIVPKDTYFKNNNKKLLAYGYSPDFTVWIKFTLKNTTNQTLYRILEYENSLSTHIKFIDISNNNVQNEGLFQIAKDRITLNPTFKIELLPEESRTFYIKANSNITTLIIKLNLWEPDTFYSKEIKHQLILALFFGSMLILGIYNLFIYFYTKDISYLFYVLYIFGITIHQLIYVGIANIYILDQNLAISFVKYASILVSFPAISLALFTKSFLEIKQYPKINLLFNISISIVFIVSILYCFLDLPQSYRNLFSALLLILLFSTTVYMTIQKNKQAYFILLGWFLFVLSGMFMYLSGIGLFNISISVKYFVEVSLVSEALIFSIALAYRIKQLEKEKIAVNKKLILQQKNETNKLEKQVQKKTLNLTRALDEKEILLKELNHRVKNNMQTMVSLIRMQVDETEDEHFKELLLTIQNRINAMGHLHELLYQHENISYVNANEYISILAYELQDSYEKNVDINLDISTNIKTNEAIYCGLILNEIITNSFKYAFNEMSNQGNILIKLFKEGPNNILIISDDGVGFDSSKSFTSLGLTLVKTLVTKKLKGNFYIDSKKGVKVKIIWK